MKFRAFVRACACFMKGEGVFVDKVLFLPGAREREREREREKSC